MLEAEAAIDEARKQPQGLIKVTAPADLGDSLLASLVAHTQQQYPTLMFELLLTDRYIDLVAEGVDVAIVPVNCAIPAWWPNHWALSVGPCLPAKITWRNLNHCKPRKTCIRINAYNLRRLAVMPGTSATANIASPYRCQPVPWQIA